MIPPSLEESREKVKSFPDAAGVAHLRDRGIRTVEALRQGHSDQQVAPEAFGKPLTGLGVAREGRPGAVLFHIAAQ